MNSIELIAFDLDGTLLNNEKRIFPEVMDAIDKLQESGRIVSIATGRPLYSTLPFVKQLNLQSYFSVSDSSIVINFNGDILLNRFIDARVMKDVCRESFEMKCGVVWATNRILTDDFFISSNDFKSESMRNFVDIESRVYALDLSLLQIRDDFTDSDYEAYMVFILGLKEDVFLLRESLERFKGRAEILSNVGLNPDYHHELIGTHDLLILRPGDSSKAYGLRTISEHYGIELRNVMFFGDWYNDIDALDCVGYPILMSNAPEELKSRDGYYITGSNNKDGILSALHHYQLI